MCIEAPATMPRAVVMSTNDQASEATGTGEPTAAAPTLNAATPAAAVETTAARRTRFEMAFGMAITGRPEHAKTAQRVQDGLR